MKIGNIKPLAKEGFYMRAFSSKAIIASGVSGIVLHGVISHP